MKIIGLTGGSGAGKSVAASELARLGAGIVDADVVYRHLCAQNKRMLSEIQSAFGDVLTENGELNRPKLAKIVFNDAAKLGQLNSITFPYIKNASEREFAKLDEAGCKIAIYDAATLFQTGADVLCEAAIGIIANRETRIKRIMSRDKISEEAAAARIDAQPSDTFFYTRCKYILKNDASQQVFNKQIKQLWDKLLA